jgi:hypothetical protein
MARVADRSGVGGGGSVAEVVSAVATGRRDGVVSATVAAVVWVVSGTFGELRPDVGALTPGGGGGVPAPVRPLRRVAVLCCGDVTT